MFHVWKILLTSGIGSNSQNQLLSDFHNPVKISFIVKFAIALTWNGETKPLKQVSGNKNTLKKLKTTVHECY